MRRDEPIALPNRANNATQKRDVMERLLKVWEAMPELRFGQLLLNVEHDGLFTIEDFDLVEQAEILQHKRGKKP
jgi:hypothetical protein